MKKMRPHDTRLCLAWNIIQAFDSARLKRLHMCVNRFIALTSYGKTSPLAGGMPFGGDSEGGDAIAGRPGVSRTGEVIHECSPHARCCTNKRSSPYLRGDPLQISSFLREYRQSCR